MDWERDPRYLARAPSLEDLRGAVVALGFDMVEWEDARYPDDAAMLDAVVLKALDMRSECPAAL